MKQRQAVFNAVTSVFEENGVHFEEGVTESATILTKEYRSQVHNILCEGFASDSIDLSDKARTSYDTPQKMSTYVSGLISNWIRKDQALNGGVAYKPKNPGSRTGSSDPEIKNLKLLLKSGKISGDQIAIVNSRIEEKQAELKAAKAKDVEIDFSVIPDSLKESLGI